eukprot:3087664-Amphidinium_carterae.1
MPVHTAVMLDVSAGLGQEARFPHQLDSLFLCDPRVTCNSLFQCSSCTIASVMLSRNEPFAFFVLHIRGKTTDTSCLLVSNQPGVETGAVTCTAAC